ncbi:MAG: M20/M25/M40 family metallo-hydrolase [Clostridia bacterium]|nr:M20/M25/M40 family metallo-hydrolase [Clostridia bacterium]
MIFLWIALGLLVLFLAVVLIRTLAFCPLPEREANHAPIDFDKEKAVEDLAAMIRCKTISDQDSSKEDEGEFEKFIALLSERFPLVHKTCSLHRPDRRALLYCWQGREEGDPTVLMAHYDVVSVEAENWSRDPFCGEIEDGVLWGRGTLDTKGTLNAILQSVEYYIQKGFTPKNTIYLAFGGDEEINGNGAPSIVQWFKDHSIHPALVVDEGGAVVQGAFPGVKRSCALVGIAEKGLMNVAFEFSGNGGHASAPPVHTAVGLLSRACLRLEGHPPKGKLTKPVAEMFNVLGRHSTFAYKLIFANLWCFSPLLKLICKFSGGELNAMVRTTCAFTTMQGSKGLNVMPPYAKMTANMRIICEDTVKETLEYVKKTVADPKIKISLMNGTDPSPISRTEGKGWEDVSAAIHDTWPEALVSPYLMMACSDSRHYRDLSDCVYRFSAMALSKEERGMIHGNDERIPLETIHRAVEFYIRLIKKR